MTWFLTLLIKFSGILCLYFIIRKFFQLTLRWAVKWKQNVNPLVWSAVQQRCGQHPCPRPIDSKLMRSYPAQQCKHLPHWPCRQRSREICDWMPASYTSRQSSHSRRHPTCWAWSERSRLSLERRTTGPGYLPHSVLTCNRVGIHGISNLDTHLYPPHNNSSFLLATNEVRRCGRITDVIRRCWTILRDSVFSSRHRHPPSWNGPSKNTVVLT